LGAGGRGSSGGCDKADLRDAAEAHRLDQLVNPPGGYAADPSLLDHRDQRFLGGLARLEKGREVRALPQFRDAQAERPEPGLEGAPRYPLR
jgi:hypothetical protein